MITNEDIHLLAPETRRLDLDRKDWREHLDKVVRGSDVGDRLVYWIGYTDVDPRGKRKEVFEVMRAYSERGGVHLYQRRPFGDKYDYIAEVR